MLLSLWERAGPGAVTAVVTSLSAAERDEALAAPVQAKLASALAAGDPEVLRAERARIAARRVTRRTEGARAPDPWQLPPEERLRDHALDSSAPHWLPEHVAGGRVPGTDLVRYGRPAAIALGVAEGVYRRPLADAGLRDALAGVAARIGPRPEAWAVFVQLLPDFTGTLAELADLAAVAAG